MIPASQWYKVRLCHIEGHEFAVFPGGCIRHQARDILLDSRLLHITLAGPGIAYLIIKSEVYGSIG